eukprot:4064039-Lingulodinium_polyedra.AAC.1
MLAACPQSAQLPAHRGQIWDLLQSTASVMAAGAHPQRPEGALSKRGPERAPIHLLGVEVALLCRVELARGGLPASRP